MVFNGLKGFEKWLVHTDYRVNTCGNCKPISTTGATNYYIT